MSRLNLVIGNKRYSSWSLRPWLALKAAGADFHENKIMLRRPDTATRIRAHSPTGKVPLLIDGDVKIWESLAICEYVADRYPAAGLWPTDPKTRAVARAIATEMHGGFAALRQEMPMDCATTIGGVTPSDATVADIARIQDVWREAREKYGAGGSYLFGRFSIADCMYAPVVTRFATYGVTLNPVAASYRDAMLADPHMQTWIAEAKTEQPFES